jgi:hypothetical protein
MPTDPAGLAGSLLLATAAGVVRAQVQPVVLPEQSNRTHPRLVEDSPSASLWAIHKQLAEDLENDLVTNDDNLQPLSRRPARQRVHMADEVLVCLVILA